MQLPNTPIANSNRLANPGPKPSGRLLVLGASVRETIQAAKADGFEPLGFDLFADRDSLAVAQIIKAKSFAALARRLKATQPAHDWWIPLGGIENEPTVLASLDARKRASCSAECVAKCNDPQQLYALLKEVSPFVPAVSEIGTVCQSKRWLKKPLSGAGGLGISFFPVLSDTSSASVERSQPEQYFLQEFIAGISMSATFFAGPDACGLLGITRQLIGRSASRQFPFRYEGSIGPLFATPTIVKQLSRLGERLFQSLQPSGFFGVDFILARSRKTNEAEVWPVEVNPRMTASIELFRRAFNLKTVAMQLADATNGSNIEWPLSHHRPTTVYAKSILYNQSARPIEIDEAFSSWAFKSACDVAPVSLGDVPNANTTIEPNQPMLTVYAQSESEHEIESVLKDAGERVWQFLRSQKKNRPV